MVVSALPFPPITFPQLRRDALALMHAGGTPELAAATIQGALSDLKSALAWQLDRHLALQSEGEARYLLDPPIGAAHVPFDVRALLSGSAAAATARARANGMRRPGNARSRVQRLLEALSDGATTSPVPIPITMIPAAWQEVVDFLLSFGEDHVDQAKLRSVATAIRNLARVATAHGVLDPRRLPSDYHALVAILRTWGRVRIAHDVWALRSASAAIRASLMGHGPLPEWSAADAIEAQRCELNTAMPAFAADLDDWCALAEKKVGDRNSASRTESAHEPLRRATRTRYVAQARQWATGFLALYGRSALPETLDPPSLHTAAVWLARVAVGGSHTATAEMDARIRARQERLGKRGIVSSTQARERPLAVVVAEMAVDAGDIWPRAKRVAGDLPPSVTQMLFALFSIAERLAIATWGDSSGEVATLRAAWSPELKQLKQQLARATGHRKHPDKLLRVVTLPQLVCGILPWRTLVDLPRRKRAADASGIAAASPNASAAARRDAAQDRAAYHDAQQRWAVQATFTVEPMRKGNVVHARVGKEIVLDAVWASDGALVSLKSVSSHFPERQEEAAEVLGTKTGQERELWRWSPAIVALDWAAEYLREVWWPTVIAHCPALAGCSLREVVELGEFAWLINPDPRSDRAGEVAGAYLADGVADLFGEALLEGLHVLGRQGFPSTLDEARRQHPWLFGPHIIRTMWATYWFGLRGENGPVRKRRDGGVDRESGTVIARRATCDTDQTLQKHYVKLRAAMIELSRSDPHSFDHPRAFDTEMDLTWWLDGSIDWRSRWRDPRFPLLDTLRRAFVEENRRDKGGATRRTRRRLSERAAPRRAGHRDLVVD
jgi:hypothetical protein